MDYSTKFNPSVNGNSANGHNESVVAAYLRDVPKEPPPTPITSDPLREAAESYHIAYKDGGVDAAYSALHNHILPTLADYPALVESVTAPRKLIHESELDTLPPPSWLIESEIPNGFTIVYGSSGAYKSFRVLDYAERIAQDTNVIYVAAEGAAGYDKRAKAWHQHHKTKPGGLYFWLDPVAMLNPQAVDTFMLAALDLRPKLIVLDTLARCMLGGDENSAKDMGLFIDACNRLQRELNTAVLVVHHTGKSNGSERGSSALRGAADGMIEMSADDGVIRVSCSKSKDSLPFEPYYLNPIEVHLPQGEISLVLLPSDRVLETETLTQNQKAIIEWLATEVFDQGARTNDLMNATNIPKGSFYGVVKTLSRRGIIEKAGKYDPWILTEKGKTLAAKYGFVGEGQ